MSSFTIVKKTALISVLSLFMGSAFSASMEERLQRLEQMAESRGQLQADIMFQLNALQQELQQLRGKVEEHEFKLKQLQDRQRDLYRDIERRLAQLQNGSATSGNSNAGANAAPSGSQNQSPKANPPSAGQSVHTDYQSTFALVRNKQYDEAITAYKQFLKNYPNSQYEANVHYWLAQIYFIQNNLDLAATEYQVVTSRHASSSRAPDALLKQGIILVRQNKTDEAKAIFNQVIEKYDGTVEQLARKELNKLK